MFDRIQRELLPFVEKPMRYVGNEINMIVKRTEELSLQGVLCFPDVYDIGMSHYGLQVLYHVVNRNPSWALARAFHPWPDAEALMREREIPLCSLEYQRPLREADWIGFTVQYELQYTNIINMLALAGVALWARERTDGMPIVIAGGPCMINPEPIADFFDAMVIGDGEKSIEAVCTMLEKHKRSGTARAQILADLSTIPGVYVPSLYPVEDKVGFAIPLRQGRPIVKATKIPLLETADTPALPLVPLIEVVHHRLAVEVMRGCTRGCRFCAAGMYYRPVRERDSDAIFQQLEEGVTQTGWRDVGLLSLSTADYSQLSTLLQDTLCLKKKHHINVALPSTRIDALSAEQMDKLDAISHATSFTIAPEAGSQRLRRVINKDFTDELILDTVKVLLNRNIQTIKLYFMVGLPTEDEDDIKAIIALTRAIAAVVGKGGGRRMVNVSISPFSPKANTPFQWEAMHNAEALTQKGRFIKQQLGNCRNVSVSYRDGRITMLETVMARGDRSVSQLIVEAWKKGARLDGWEEYFNLGRWEEAAKVVGLSFDRYLGAIDIEQELPWSAVDCGVTTTFLKQERLRAIEELPTTDCRVDACSACGVCRIASMHQSESKSDPVSIDKVESAQVASAVATGRYFYRLAYQKKEQVRFLGHRDMVNILERAFLAAGVPVEYSQGFHAHPRMAFGPPLPLGVMGNLELLDFVTVEPWNFDRHALSPWLPAGLALVSCVSLATKPPSISSEIAASRYRFAVSGAMSAVTIQQRIASVLEASALPVQSNKEGKKAAKDIRPLISELCQEGSGTLFEAILSSVQEGSCSPGNLLSVLFPDRPFTDFTICRMQCLRQSRDGMQVMGVNNA